MLEKKNKDKGATNVKRRKMTDVLVNNHKFIMFLRVFIYFFLYKYHE